MELTNKGYITTINKSCQHICFKNSDLIISINLSVPSRMMPYCIPNYIKGNIVSKIILIYHILNLYFPNWGAIFIKLNNSNYNFPFTF